MRQRRFYSLMLIICFCSSLTAVAQKAERKNVREGNKQYNREDYEEATKSYRRSLDVNPNSMEGLFNLANALYKQSNEEKYQEASELYLQIAQQGQRLLNDDPENAEKLSQVFHNLGNIGMKTKQYAQSVDAYKQALRLNPTDDETRYNLALAQKLLEDQEGDGDGGGDDENQDDEQQQENNEQQEDQDNENNQDQQQPEEQNQDNQQQEEQQQNEQMSRDNAQQILDALLEDEKDTQEKVQKAQQQQMERRRTDKEW